MNALDLAGTFVAQDHLVAVAVLLGSAAVSYFAVLRRDDRFTKQQKPWPKVPGSLPLLGHFPYIGSIYNLITKMEEWADAYGTKHGCYEIDFPGIINQSYVVVCREDIALDVYKHRPRRVQRQGQLREATDSIGAKGVFSAEGVTWRDEHKLVAAALNQHHTADYLPIVKQSARRLIAKWKVASKRGPIVINNDLGAMTADSIAQVLLDQDFDFVNRPNSKMATQVKTVFRAAMNRAMSPIWYWRTPVVGQYLDGYGFAIASVWNTVVKAVEKIQQQCDSSKCRTFLSNLFQIMHHQRASKMSKERVAGNAITIFLAGTDTTEKALVQALFVLATRQDLQEELRNEVSAYKWEAASLDSIFHDLPKTKSFLHEVHRCYAMPGLMLETSDEINLSNGGVLPAGQSLWILNRYCGMQKHAASKHVPRGPDDAPPQVFNARRYLQQNEKNGKLICPPPSTEGMAFTPFGYGVRACPGRRYSEALSYCFLAALLQEFSNIQLTPHHPSTKLIYDAVAMVPDKDIQLHLRA